MNRASHRRIEQSRNKSAVNRPQRIIKFPVRFAFKNGASRFDLRQKKIEAFADRRRRKSARDHLSKNVERFFRAPDFYRDQAVFYRFGRSHLFTQFFLDLRRQTRVVRHNVGRDARNDFAVFADEKFFKIP